MDHPDGAGQSLGGALVAPNVKHHPAIVSSADLGKLLKAIDHYEGQPSTVMALKLIPHLFPRPGELRHMLWMEIDLEEKIWRIPAEKTKMRREHVVPLSRQVIALLGSQRALSGHSEYVLPAHHTPNQPISENAMNQALRRMGFSGLATAHGFRSTASSLLNESGLWNSDAIECALAHMDHNRVRAIYNRSNYWEERVRMMAWWSDYLDEIRES